MKNNKTTELTSVQDVLATPGIVVRRIPFSITSFSCSSEKIHKAHKEKGGSVYTDDEGREYMVTNRKPSYAGKYLITVAYSSDKTVMFCKGSFGVGDTVLEAYNNFMRKR